MPNPDPPFPSESSAPDLRVPLPADFPLTPTLQDLQALDLDLAHQEQRLESQLQAIRAQRQSLQRVLQLLQATQPEMASPQPAAPDRPATASPSPISPDSPPQPGTLSPTLPSPTSPSPALPRRTEPTRSSLKSSAKSAKSTDHLPHRPPKSSPKAPRSPAQAPWQRYLKPQYQALALGDTIRQVLDQQPDRVFAIAEITDFIFEGLTLEVSMQAHDRVSHVLAEGARRGQWFRPKLGHYQSKTQTKAEH